jgi:hypothetical protein
MYALHCQKKFAICGPSHKVNENATRVSPSWRLVFFRDVYGAMLVVITK